MSGPRELHPQPSETDHGIDVLRYAVPRQRKEDHMQADRLSCLADIGHTSALPLVLAQQAQHDLNAVAAS
jgi:hypothetical protein